MNKEHVMTPAEAAELLGSTPQTIRVAMEQGALPIGIVIQGKVRNRYIITKEKFTQVTGIEVK